MLRVCEGKTMTIKCKQGMAINVLEASYGRHHGKEVCRTSTTWIKTKDCHSVNTLSKVQELCQGKNSCIIASKNKQFGDPCKGTYKYLTVNYECKKRTTGQSMLLVDIPRLYLITTKRQINKRIEQSSQTLVLHATDVCDCHCVCTQEYSLGFQITDAIVNCTPNLCFHRGANYHFSD